jgi:hypothetical protein
MPHLVVLLSEAIPAPWCTTCAFTTSSGESQAVAADPAIVALHKNAYILVGELLALVK